MRPVADAPVVFAASYESLIRLLGNKLDARAHERFRAHGVDLTKPLLTAYPLATWIESLKVTMDLIAPGESVEVASHKVGRRLVTSLTETTVGKALFALLRVIGLKRGFHRFTRTLRMTNNYSETRATEQPDGSHELWCSQVTYPHYYRGVLEAGLESLGAQDIKVQVLSHDAAGATFSLRFR
jgi:uncharacterized protein (TIGR02265 family)